MPIENAENLLRALLAGTTTSDIRKVLESIGDSSGVELDQPFGKFQFCWHAFGNRQSNISSIGLASKPGRSLTERITNAIDAVLEDRVPRGVATLPNSAREAAQQWFGRPVSSPTDGLFNWDYSAGQNDRRYSVVLTPSGVEGAPTVDVIDEGIGITPEEFPGTILSLQEGNKIKKWYLIGAFGQGGASTLSFSEYAIIMSRHRDNPRVVGFTAIRVLNLSESYKEDCYAYLSLKGADGTISVPSCQLNDDPLMIYPDQGGVKVPTLHHGTLVRHVGFKLPKLDGSLAPSPGNLYHFLHCSAFDPLLPFRLIDLRGDGEMKNELVSGSRNRLMKLDEMEGDPAKQESGTYLRYHREMEFFAPHGTQDPCIGIELWVIFNYRKGRGDNKDQTVLRPHSNELFVMTGQPVVATLNGQNQGEMPAALLRDLELTMVARHIVIHVDASRADNRVRRELFSTNREGFKDGPVLSSLVSMLEKMLGEDETLHEIERELTEKLAKRESQTTSDDVKHQIVKLLQEAGLKIQTDGPTSVAGGGEELEPVKKRRRGKHKKADPLPTLPFPQVTEFEIVYPKPTMKVHLNDNESILVHTDADHEFDRRGLVAIRTEPDCLELAGKSPLNGGRIRWRLRPRQTAKVGDVGKIVTTITTPDGRQLTDTTDFEVLAALEQKAKKAKGLVPKFEVIPINPTDDPEQWAAAWPDLSDENASEDQTAVAYKPVSVGGGIVVYYSTIFAPFKEQMDRLKQDSPALPALFRTNYEIWIGYHAILQENARDGKANIDEDALEAILEEDRIRVAKMQVKQAKATADLMNKVMKEKAGD